MLGISSSSSSTSGQLSHLNSLSLPQLPLVTSTTSSSSSPASSCIPRFYSSSASSSIEHSLDGAEIAEVIGVSSTQSESESASSLLLPLALTDEKKEEDEISSEYVDDDIDTDINSMDNINTNNNLHEGNSKNICNINYNSLNTNDFTYIRTIKNKILLNINKINTQFTFPQLQEIKTTLQFFINTISPTSSSSSTSTSTSTLESELKTHNPSENMEKQEFTLDNDTNPLRSGVDPLDAPASNCYLGKLPVRCGDFGRTSIVSKVLEEYLEFWNLFHSHINSSNTNNNNNNDSISPKDINHLTLKELREIQKDLLLDFQNYSFALESWGLIIVPVLFDLPKIGYIRTVSKMKYCPMLAPVTSGSAIYIDRIKTAQNDMMKSISRFIEFEVDRPCTIWLAWDFKLKRDVNRVMKITLGGCNANSKSASNYFILISNLNASNMDASTSSASTSSASTSSASTSTATTSNHNNYNSSLYNDQNSNHNHSHHNHYHSHHMDNILLPCWYLKSHTLMNTLSNFNTHNKTKNNQVDVEVEDDIEVQQDISYDFLEDYQSVEVERNPNNDDDKDNDSSNNNIINKFIRKIILKVMKDLEYSVLFDTISLKILDDEQDTVRLNGIFKNLQLKLDSSCEVEVEWLSRFHKLDIVFSTQLQLQHEVLAPYGNSSAYNDNDMRFEDIIHPYELQLSLLKSSANTLINVNFISEQLFLCDITPEAMHSILYIIEQIQILLDNTSTSISTSKSVVSLPTQIKSFVIKNKYNSKINKNKENFNIIIENSLGQEIWLLIEGLTMCLDSNVSTLSDIDMDNITAAACHIAMPPGGRVAFKINQQQYTQTQHQLQQQQQHNTTDLNDIKMNCSIEGWTSIDNIHINTHELSVLYPIQPLIINHDIQRISNNNKEGVSRGNSNNSPYAVVVDCKYISKDDLMPSKSSKDVEGEDGRVDGGGLTSLNDLKCGDGTWVDTPEVELASGRSTSHSIHTTPVRTSTSTSTSRFLRPSGASSVAVGDNDIEIEEDDNDDDSLLVLRSLEDTLLLVTFSTNIYISNESAGTVHIFDNDDVNISGGYDNDNDYENENEIGLGCSILSQNNKTSSNRNTNNTTRNIYGTRTRTRNDRRGRISLQPNTSYPLPLHSLHTGELYLYKENIYNRNSNSNNDYDNNNDNDIIRLSINKCAFDQMMSAQLRRSIEYESQSVILSELPAAKNIQNNHKKVSSTSTNTNTSSTSHYMKLNSRDNLSYGRDDDYKKDGPIDHIDECQQNKVCQWVMVLQPAFIFTNTLPCTIHLQISQPPHTTPSLSDSDGVRGMTDGAQQIFFLPEGFYSYADSPHGIASNMQAIYIQEYNGWEAFNNNSSINTNNNTEEKNNNDNNDSNDNNKYMSTIIIKSGKEYSLPAINIDRTFYFRIGIPGMSYWSQTFTIPINLHQHRIPFHKHKPESVHWNFSKFQNYDDCRPPSVYVQRHWDVSETRHIDIYSKYWIINKSGLLFKYSTIELEVEAMISQGLTLENLQVSTSIENNTSTWKLGHLSDKIQNNLPILPNSYDDIQHEKFLKSGSIPIMMDCPNKALKLLPYSSSSTISNMNKDDVLFYIYNIETNLNEFEYVISAGLHSLNYYLLPSSSSSSSSSSTNNNNSNTTNSNHQHNNNNNTNMNTNTRFVLKWPQLLTNGYKYVGESVERDGMADEQNSYHMYRRFYRNVSRIKLGGNKGQGPYFNTDKAENLEMYFVVIIRSSSSSSSSDSIEPIANVDFDIMNNAFSYQLRCRFLSNYQCGDILFSDNESSRLTELPGILRKMNLFAILTANRDKNLRGNELLTICLLQTSRVFLCIDNKISQKLLPRWIIDCGFQKTQYIVRSNSEPYAFQVFSSTFPSGPIAVGGMGGSQSRLDTKHKIQSSHPSSQSSFDLHEAEACGLISNNNFNSNSGNKDNRDFHIRNFWDDSDHAGTASGSDSIGGISTSANTSNLSGNNSKMILQDPPLDSLQRQWSEQFRIDNNGTGSGTQHRHLTVSGCAVSLSIQPLQGVFKRTSTISLLPRYIIVNRTNFPLCCWPHVGSQMSLLEYFRDQISSATSSNNHNNGNSSSHMDHTAPPCNTMLQPMDSCVIYNFWRENIPYNNTSTTSISTATSSDMRRCVSFQSIINDDNTLLSNTITNRERIDMKTLSTLALSREVCIEQMGERFIWLIHTSNTLCKAGTKSKTKSKFMRNKNRNIRSILRISITITGVSTILTVEDVSKNAPFRLENRSIAVTLRFRQYGYQAALHSTSGPDEEYSGWTDLPPHSWRSFIWLDYDVTHPRLLEVSVLGQEDVTVTYPLDELAQTRVQGIKWGKTATTKSSSSLTSTSTSTSPSSTRIHHIRNENKTNMRHKNNDNNNNNESNNYYSLHNDNENGSLGACVYLDHSIRVLTFFEENQTSLISDKKSVISRGLKYSSDFLNFNINTFENENDNRSQYLRASNTNTNNNPSTTSSIYTTTATNNNNKELAWQELIGISIEGIQIQFDGIKTKFSMTIFHIQLDDMRSDAKFPVILIGSDSGLNSHIKHKSDIGIDNILQNLNVAPVYIESLYISPIVLQLQVFASPNLIHLDPSSMDGPVAAGFAILGAPVLSFLGSIIGSIAHISPTFSFSELYLSNYFGLRNNLFWMISHIYIRQAVTQGYKVFGSMEILGDPLSFVTDIRSGFLDFIRTTHAEMVGRTDTRGHGVRILANALIGSTFGSASRMTSTLANMVKSAAATATTTGVSQGLRQGGEVFVQSVVAGISGLVEEPARGHLAEGIAGAVKGTCKGVLGLVAAPVAGALGAVALLTESVEMSAKFWKGRPVGRRRQRRMNSASKVMDMVVVGGITASNNINNGSDNGSGSGDDGFFVHSKHPSASSFMMILEEDNENDDEQKSASVEQSSAISLFSPIFPSYSIYLSEIQNSKDLLENENKDKKI
eukprot:gene2324-4520_t